MRRIATALLLLVASMSAPPAFAVTGVDSAAQAVIRDAGDNRLVMVGELHGTSEVPALVAARRGTAPGTGAVGRGVGVVGIRERAACWN